ncbi:GMC oxidoreductase [Panus rudis PR-1116 ss-1]|nr:GMC oxidoreductase [Panus rudis PR-1116 ss-1]
MSTQLASLYDVADKKFDYVIIAGSVLANRLSEDPSVSVALLEAGGAHIDDPLICMYFLINHISPNGWQLQLGNDAYDWGFITKPQERLEGLQIHFFRGKGLGGTSAMNCMAWLKPHKEEIDAIEALGNPGWNWDNFERYSKKSERVFAPPLRQRPFQGLYNPQSVGTNGPVKVSFSPVSSGVEYPLQKSLNTLGIETNFNPVSMLTRGTFKGLSAMDPESLTRSYSANSYIFPVLERDNLKVLPEAFVTKIICTVSAGEKLTASAVEFEYAGRLYTVSVGKEAILSAGAIKSPHILELSGIGDREILEPLGITVKHHLPSVGTNSQEHLALSGPVHLLRKDRDLITGVLLADPNFRSTLKDKYDEVKGTLPLLITGFTFVPLQGIAPVRAAELIEKQTKKIAEQASAYPPGRKELQEAQLQLLKNASVPDAEILAVPYTMMPLDHTKGPYATIPAVVNHPFTRGTIHAVSSDPHVAPEIDPHSFEEEIDFEIVYEGFKLSRRAAQVSPLADIIQEEALPGSDVSTEEAIKSRLSHGYGLTFSQPDTSGTCSMLPQDKGGVVDPKLKVYGTNNIRVVDLSILPLIVATHPLGEY